MSADGAGWSLVVPVKPAAVGKSRLVVPGVDREALARAIALDTLDAASRASRVAEVVVVTDDAGVRTGFAPAGDAADLRRRRRSTPDSPTTARIRIEPAPRARVVFVADPGEGLNRAVAAGLDAATVPLRAAMLGDLPALRPADLDAALAHACPDDAENPCRRRRSTPDSPTTAQIRAVPAPRAVADADGTGTTLLALARPEALRFGADSYARHLAAGAEPLQVPAASTLRHDVDTAAHLRAAAALGLGPRTAALLR